LEAQRNMGLYSDRSDQASGLKRLHQANRPVKVISVVSGKGGVGKTNVSVNLAIAMANLNKHVMLLDADLGLANIDVLLGLSPQNNLSHVIAGECALEDVIVPGPGGVEIIPASSGLQHMVKLGEAQHVGLIRAFSALTNRVDTLVIDNAAGISESVGWFCKAANEVVVVVCDEPTSITDAYATIKVLNRDHGIQRFQILTNMTQTAQNGRDLYEKLYRVCDRFLDVTIGLLGVIPYDESLKKAVQRQKPVVDAFPRSRVALAFKNLAQKADNWPVPANAAGHLVFFVERLIQASQEKMEATI